MTNENNFGASKAMPYTPHGQLCLASGGGDDDEDMDAAADDHNDGDNIWLLMTVCLTVKPVLTMQRKKQVKLHG